MEISKGETRRLDFTTHNPTTGIEADADEAPTAWVYEEGDNTPIAATVTKRAGKVGEYYATVDTSNAEYEVGKNYNLYARAIVASRAQKISRPFFLRARDADDLLPTASYTAPDNSGIAAVKAKTDNLPASPANEATLNAVKARTDLIPASPATEGNVTAVGVLVMGIKAKTDQLAFTSGKVQAAIIAADDFVQAAADKVWVSATRTLTALGTAATTQFITDWLATDISGAFSAGTVKEWIRKTYAYVAGKKRWNTALRKLFFHDPLDGTPAPGGVVTEFDLNFDTNPTERTPV